MNKDILTLVQQARNDDERDWLVMQLSLDSLNPELREAVWAASILRWFDIEYLKATLDNTAFNRFDDLIALSFVEPFENRGYNIHERSRKLLERHLWNEKPEYYRQLSLHAFTYSSTQNLKDTLWMIEYISHMLVAKPEQGHDEFNSICIRWFNPPFFAYEKIEALTCSVRERGHATLDTPESMCYCLYWEARIDSIKYRYTDALDKVIQIEKYKIKNPWLISKLKTLQGDVERMQDQYDAAKTHYEQALPIYREIGDKLGEANTLKAQGDVERMQDQYDAAKTHYEQALPIYREIGDKLGEANTLQAQGDVEIMQDQYDAAKTHYEQALPIYREIGSKLGEANTLQAQGDVERMQDQYDAAKTHYEQALPIYREIGSKLGEANTLKAQGDVERIQDQYDAAKTHYEQALPIYREIGDKLGEANTLKAQGDVERMQDQYDAAKTHYEQALPIYREIGSKLGEANTLKAQGDVERMQKMFGNAKRIYEKALNIYCDIKDRFGESDCVFAFGELLRSQGRWHEAANKYKKALDFYKEKGLRSEQAFVLWQLGMAAKGAENNKLAIAYLKEAFGIYKAIKSPRFQKVKEVIDAFTRGIPYDAKEQFE